MNLGSAATRRYREPGKAVLKFAAYMLAKKLMGDTPNGQ